MWVQGVRGIPAGLQNPKCGFRPGDSSPRPETFWSKGDLLPDLGLI